jgi:AbrB family looped-hinge helix DNA binding protein
MQCVVKVTRKGQTTIPAQFREKLGIKEGDQLVVEATENGVLFRLVARLNEMAGVDSPEEVKKSIDKQRVEF